MSTAKLLNTPRKLQKHYTLWNSWPANEKITNDFKNRVIRAIHLTAGEFITKQYQIEAEWRQLFPKEIDIAPYITEYEYDAMESVIELADQVRIRERLFGSTEVYKDLKAANSLQEVINYLQCLCFLLTKHNYSKMNELADKLQETLDYSPSINIRLKITKDSITLYPKGARLLDDVAVGEVLEWLETYPSAHNHFRKALNIYYSGNKGEYDQLLDQSRKSLENLLRKILGNKKSFENQKVELLRWIEQKGVQTQIVSMYQNLLFGPYRIYQNDAVKHGEVTNFMEEEVEFVIYMTGTFMRLLIQLHKK